MESTIWLALFAGVVISTSVGLWGPEPAVTGYAGVMTTILSGMLSVGAMNYEVTSQGVPVAYNHPGVAVVFGINGLLGLVIVAVGIFDWYADEPTPETPISNGGDTYGTR